MPKHNVKVVELGGVTYFLNPWKKTGLIRRLLGLEEFNRKVNAYNKDGEVFKYTQYAASNRT